MKNYLSSYRLGLVTWLIFTGFILPTSPFSLTWVYVLLLAAPLWLIPLYLKVIAAPNLLQVWAVPLALPLAVAYFLEASTLAGILTLPWLLFCVLASKIGFHTVAHHCSKAAFLYLPIGAAWMTADRLAWQVMGFDATIVLLTAAHFHYAGFILPMLTAQLQRFYKNKWTSLITWGVVLGIPLVAIGITTSQFDLPPPIEVLAVTVMATSGFFVGLGYLLLGIKHRRKGFGLLWILCGLALMVGMTLAFLYGWRYYFPISFLSIPWMYAVHGTLNAVGFAIPGVLAWHFWHKEK